MIKRKTLDRIRMFDSPEDVLASADMGHIIALEHVRMDLLGDAAEVRHREGARLHGHGPLARRVGYHPVDGPEHDVGHEAAEPGAGVPERGPAAGDDPVGRDASFWFCGLGRSKLSKMN